MRADDGKEFQLDDIQKALRTFLFFSFYSLFVLFLVSFWTLQITT